MLTTQISLTDAERDMLQVMSGQTGKSTEDLIHEGLGLLIARSSLLDRRAALQQARGIWRDRDDLPDLAELRAEWDRS